MGKQCIIDECDRKKVARGLCTIHYYRWRRHGDPLGGRVAPGVPMAWLEEHKNYKGDDCLIWPFGLRGKGYGTIKYMRRDRYAHEIMIILLVGDKPDSQYVARHLCGRGHDRCINPRHLVWGTRTENAQDSIAHGTHARGERSTSAKLTEHKARDIKIKLKAGILKKDIAAEYGIHVRHVDAIKRGEYWGWVNP